MSTSEQERSSAEHIGSSLEFETLLADLIFMPLGRQFPEMPRVMVILAAFSHSDSSGRPGLVFLETAITAGSVMGSHLRGGT
jgi:hypothetical protein